MFPWSKHYSKIKATWPSIWKRDQVLVQEVAEKVTRRKCVIFMLLLQSCKRKGQAQSTLTIWETHMLLQSPQPVGMYKVCMRQFDLLLLLCIHYLVICLFDGQSVNSLECSRLAEVHFQKVFEHHLGDCHPKDFYRNNCSGQKNSK